MCATCTDQNSARNPWCLVTFQEGLGLFLQFFRSDATKFKYANEGVIDAMGSQFARHGVPELVMSDNGSQFSCGEFREFAQIWDFEHITRSPRYP